jgi:phosphoesterase RecJ-like protein
MHTRPDGDAVGGALALGKILEKAGVDVEIISPTPPPAVYNFFTDFKKIKTGLPAEKKDIGFVLDCSDEKRLESLHDTLNYAKNIINIDHHQLNHEFGKINYIRPDCSSTCELIFNIALQMNIDFDYDLALYLYVGILTDTNRFQEQNTTVQSHLIAAELVEKFVSPVEVSSRIYGNNELNILRLVANAINNLALNASKQIGYITVTPKMLEDKGVQNEDLEGIINYARNIKGVEVGILFRKIPELKGVKVSFRSKGKVDVSKVARQFGGGGHHNAAGCLIEGGFKKAINNILEAVEKEFKKLPTV